MAESEEEKEKEEQTKFRDKNVYKISQIIGAINPDKYAANSPSEKKEIKALLKENKFWEAADKIKPKPAKQFFLSYNSSSESLEPVYFWILDYISKDGAVVEKLVDNFQSSPGSGHFSELVGKGTKMQEEAMKIMQTIGVLIKSVINIIWDLRQFEIRLKDYTGSKSKKPEEAEAALIGLKQIWMDNVDVKRGNTSIKGLAFSQASFATLIDAFMAAKSLEQIKKPESEGGFDLNERVRRILEQRFFEFENWRKMSEKELQKRYNIERAWLKSQVDSLKLYTRWAKPYLKAAEELRMMEYGNPGLVKAFNTILLNLTLLRKDKINVEQGVLDKELPKGFEKLDEKKKIRKFFSCVLIDFLFRGIPQRVDQHYAFGGKSDVTFQCYALNAEELAMLDKKLEDSDIKEALGLVHSSTDESLKEIEADIRYFLEGIDEREKEESEEEKDTEDINPFAALLGFSGKSSKKKEEKKALSSIESDNYAEKVLRSLAEFKGMKTLFNIYDVYKKAHGMASVPFADYFSQANVDVEFKDVFKK